MLARFTTRPQPRSRMPGTKTRMVFTVPSTLMSRTRRHDRADPLVAGVVRHDVRDKGLVPGSAEACHARHASPDGVYRLPQRPMWVLVTEVNWQISAAVRKTSPSAISLKRRSSRPLAG